ncbi:acyltransferase family protein [Microvirga sp. P5_D2]
MMAENKVEERLYLAPLDGLRLFAFLTVFIHHIPAPTTSPTLTFVHAYGWAGVELFFVISAFLFFHLFKAEKRKSGSLDIKRFYLRRLIRIYPLMVCFPALMLILYRHRDATEVALRFIGLALFSDNLITWFDGYNPIRFTRHLWTLSFEFQIYLIIPLAFVAFTKLGTKRFMMMLLGVFCFCLALRLVFTGLGAHHPIVWVTPFLQPDAVIAGVLLSLLVVKKIPVWGCALLFAGSTFSFLNTPAPWAGVGPAALSYPSAAIMCASLVVLALRWQPLGALFSWKPVAFLGSISFGLYVYHLLGNHLAAKTFLKLQMAVNPAADARQFALFFVTSLTITITMSIVSYYVLERPLLRLKDRFATVKGRP